MSFTNRYIVSRSLHHAYYSQITRQRAVLKAIKIQIASVKAVVSRSDRALERLHRFHFVINHCFVSRFQIKMRVIYGNHALMLT